MTHVSKLFTTLLSYFVDLVHASLFRSEGWKDQTICHACNESHESQELRFLESGCIINLFWDIGVGLLWEFVA